jgi:N-acetylglutamate synthase-like GNAT family acetyltransferase
MGTVIRRAVPSDLLAVFKLVSSSPLTRLPLVARQRGFSPVWGGQEPYFGYLLEDEGEVVGFLGTLHTRREIQGKMEDLCELYSWYVRPKYRNQSINLLMPVLAQRRTKTIFVTPTLKAHGLLRQLGFQDLETSLLLFFPVPMGLRSVEIVTDPWRVPEHLDGEDLRIFNDHKDIHCLHMLLRERGRPGRPAVYAMVKTMRRRWFERFGRVLYTSDPERFAALLGSVCWRLCARHRWTFMAADARAFEGIRPSTYSKQIPRGIPTQFISTRLQASDILPLYSQPLLMGYPLH